MNLSEKQITLIYPEGHNLGKQAYAHAVNQNIPIYHLDPVKTPFTGTDIYSFLNCYSYLSRIC